MGQGSRREAGKSPVLRWCWAEFRGPLVAALRGFGLSLWQPFPYEEAELLATEVASDPNSKLHYLVQERVQRDATPQVSDTEREHGAALLAKLSGIVA